MKPKPTSKAPARARSSAKPAAKSADRPVWSHSGGGPDDDGRLCLAYCAGRDVAGRPPADAALLPWDVWTNLAHCAMLRRARIVSDADFAAIAGALARIEADAAEGRFALDPGLEDVHINVERAIARIAGEAPAGVVHTARSRNDQTATDVRLWMRDRLLHFREALAGTVGALAGFAREHAETVMGGWTHGQPAMPTTLGHWAAAHGFALARDVAALGDLWPGMNLCPLGSAAGFGTSWPIDRALAAKWLGFDGPQENSLDAVSTRWELESRLGFALATAMTHLSSLGQDLYFLSSPPRRLVTLAPAFTTGSSIMPQKRNPDFAEVTRARAASAHAQLAALSAVGRGALSGYNRDSQWSKYWIMDLCEEVGEAPKVFARAVETLTVDREGLARTAREEFVSAVDLADRLARTRKVPFREIYHVVGRSVFAALDAGEFRLDVVNRELAAAGIAPPMTEAELRGATEAGPAIRERTSPGGPSPAAVRAQADALDARAAEARRWTAEKRGALAKARASLEKERAAVDARRPGAAERATLRPKRGRN